MTIAKGMSNIKAEREIVLQGFREQIDVVEQSKVIQEQSIKAKLYDIITDNSISDEEKFALKKILICGNKPHAVTLPREEAGCENKKKRRLLALYSWYIKVSETFLPIKNENVTNAHGYVFTCPAHSVPIGTEWVW